MPEPAADGLVFPDAVGFFISGYPDGIVSIAHQLRAVVLQAVPGAMERLGTRWALVAYDMPLGRTGKRYFAWIGPERQHIHLGFEYGALMADPQRVLEGAHIRLRRVRYVTFEPGATVNVPSLVELTREAARVASMPRAERVALALSAS